MRISNIFLLLVLTLSLTNCIRPDLTATPAAPSPVTVTAPTPAPTTEPTRAAPIGMFASAQLSFVPNIETVGIYVSGENLPETADLFYRSGADADWQRGHPLIRIPDGRLVGSVFGALPATHYEVKVTAIGSEIEGVVTTQPDELTFLPQAVIYVNAAAPEGGDGSAASPYRAIQEGIDRASAGTQVLVADGVYREALTFPASGAAGQWIQVKAAGEGAILDSSEDLARKEWIALAGVGKAWYLKDAQAIAYLARNGSRFYNYDDLASLKQGRGHGHVKITEGWFYDARAAKLYVRSIRPPSEHTWQSPRLNHAFDINGRDWIWIEGFEIRYYGTGLEGCGVCALNASHVVIRRNRMHNLQLGIFINWNGADDQGNDTRIEFNEMYDPQVDAWNWKAVKGSSMEGTAIVLRGRTGAIVRGNHIHNYFNGIYTGSSAESAIENPAVTLDADVYDNNIHNIGDDGLEPEGACVNHRFRDNRVDAILVGVSIAPVTQGPTWVIRNTFTNFTSTSIKWAGDPDGRVLIYHNTSWTNEEGIDAMSIITSMKNAAMLNNIFQGNGYAFRNDRAGATGNLWNFNNWYTTRGAAGPPFRWESIAYQSMTQLCAATGLECNGHENPPGLVNPPGDDFTLLPSSPNIDRGVIIPGINDHFVGSAPDIGAYEFTSP